MHKFRKLLVWTKAMEFVTHVYAVTATYPKYELYGLVDQIRRAAVSIALNIAEGSGAGGEQSFSVFYDFHSDLGMKSSPASRSQFVSIMEVVKITKH